MKGLAKRLSLVVCAAAVFAGCGNPWMKRITASLYDKPETPDDPAVPVVTSVTVSPMTADVGKGGALQFTAVVNGTGGPAQTVTWSVEGAVSSETTIFPDGLLTVAIAETATSLTVQATSTVDPAVSGTADVTVSDLSFSVTSVTVNPMTANVSKGATQQFSAVVNGTGSLAQTVTWSVTGAVSSGTGINAGGLLTVDAAETATSLTVRATSTVDPAVSGTAAITVSDLPFTVTGVTVNPVAADVSKGGTLTFSAVVNGTGGPAQTVTWGVTGAVSGGTGISTGGLLTVDAAETATSLTVQATSTADTGKSGAVTVTVGMNDEDFGIGIVPDQIFNVTDAAKWDDALASIITAGSGNYNYVINVTEEISLTSLSVYYPPGSNTFGPVGAVTGITVSLRGGGSLTSDAPGSFCVVTYDQELIIRDLTLEWTGSNNYASLLHIGYGGTATLKDGGKITGNNADSVPGGGVYISGGSGPLQTGTFIMDGGEISDNTTSWHGGGVYVGPDASFIMKGGEIKGNTTNGTSTTGGGVYVDAQATEFRKEGGTIYGYPDNKYTTLDYGACGHAVYAENGVAPDARYRDDIVSNNISVSGGGLSWGGTWYIAP